MQEQAAQGILIITGGDLTTSLILLLSLPCFDMEQASYFLSAEAPNDASRPKPLWLGTIARLLPCTTSPTAAVPGHFVPEAIQCRRRWVLNAFRTNSVGTI